MTLFLGFSSLQREFGGSYAILLVFTLIKQNYILCPKSQGIQAKLRGEHYSNRKDEKVNNAKQRVLLIIKGKIIL